MNKKIKKLLKKIRKKSSVIDQEIYETKYAIRAGKIDLEHRITNKTDSLRYYCSIDEQKEDLESYETELEILRKLQELGEVIV